MRHALSYAFALVAVGVLALAAEPAAAQTLAPGPYYATPSWDQSLLPSTRFIVLSNFNNEAVLDRETGLVWERSPSTDHSAWFFAILHCAGRAQGWAWWLASPNHCGIDKSRGPNTNSS